MSKSQKLPALQFYPGDWKKDPGIQALEFFDRHVWFELLLLMHDSEERGVLILNGKPMPLEAVSRSLGLDKQILTNALTKILDYGVASRRHDDGAIYSRRMVRDEEIRKIRTIAGLQGGNPNLLKQKPTTQVKQKSTPSSSSSSSSSSSDLDPPLSPLRGKRPNLKIDDIDFPPSLDTPNARAALADWLDYKTARNQKYKSAASVHALLKQWERSGSAGFVEAIQFSMGNNYSGIFAGKNGNGAHKKAFNIEAMESNLAVLAKIINDEEQKERTVEI